MRTISATRRVYSPILKEYVLRSFTLFIDEGALVDLLANDAVKNKSGRAQIGAGAVRLVHTGAVK